MGKVNVVIVDATGNKEQKVGLPDDIKCGIIMVKLVEKIKLPSVGPDGNPISYKFIHKVTGRQLLEAQTLGEAGIKDGDVLRLQPEITAGAVCSQCGNAENDGELFCSKCGASLTAPQTSAPNYNAAPSYSTGPKYTVAPDESPQKAKKKIKGRIPCIFGMLASIVSMILGFSTLSKYTGAYESASSYGGDAYTGIQNAAAQTANNVRALAEIVAAGFGNLLIAIGLIFLFYFIVKMRSLSNAK